MSLPEPDIISTADYEEYADPQQPEKSRRQWASFIPTFRINLTISFPLLKDRVAQDENLDLNSSVSIISRAGPADPSYQSYSYYSSNLPSSTIRPEDFCKWRLLRPLLFWFFLFCLSCSAVTLISIILAGCTSANLKNVYVLSLHYTQINELDQINSTTSAISFDLLQEEMADLSLTVGYLGMCIAGGDNLKFCSSTADIAGVVNNLPFLNHDESSIKPFDIIRTGRLFGEEMLLFEPFCVTIALAVIQNLVLIRIHRLIGLRNTTAPYDPSINIDPFKLSIACATSVMAFLMCLISTLMQHLSSLNEAKMITDLSYGIIHANVGYISVALSWAATGVLALESFGVIIMARGWILVQRKLETENSETGTWETNTSGDRSVATRPEVGEARSRDSHL